MCRQILAWSQLKGGGERGEGGGREGEGGEREGGRRGEGGGEREEGREGGREEEKREAVMLYTCDGNRSCKKTGVYGIPETVCQVVGGHSIIHTSHYIIIVYDH